MLLKKGRLSVFDWSTGLMIVLFCIAVFLRLGPLINRDFWEDELFSISFASRSYSVVGQLLHPLDDRPPLFYLFVRGMLVFTHDETLLRLPSFIASLSIIFIGYRMLAKQSKVLGLIAAAVFVFSPFAVEYGWQLRDYGFLLPISVLSGYVLFKIAETLWKDSQARPNHLYIWLTVLSFLGCGLNYIYFVFLLSMLFVGSILMWFWGKRSKKLAKGIGYIWLFQLPVMSIVVQLILGQSSRIISTTSWIPKLSAQGIEGLLASMGGFSFSLDEIFQMVDVWLWRESLILLMVLILALEITYRKRLLIPRILKFYLSLGIGTFLVNLLVIAIMTWMIPGSLFLPRTFLPAVMLFQLSLAICIYLIAKQLRQFPVSFVVVILCVATLWSSSYWESYFNRYPALWGDERVERFKTFQPLIEVVDDNLRPNSHLVFLPIHYQQLFLSSYFSQNDMYFSRLAFAIEDRVQGKNVEYPSKFGGVVQRIILFRLKSYVDPTYYDKTYLTHNQNIEAEVMRLCGGTLNQVTETADFFIDECIWTE